MVCDGLQSLASRALPRLSGAHALVHVFQVQIESHYPVG